MARTVLVTGIAGGIGQALKSYFLECGDTVIGFSSSLDNSESENFKLFNVNIADEVALRTVFQQLRKSDLLPDVVINNSAVNFSVSSALTSQSHFQKCFDVNLLGAFLVTREAVKLMKKRAWGRVIFLSSINTVLNSSGAIAYNATKKGLEGLMSTFAQETLNLDITFNSLGLSIVEGTAMERGLNHSAKQDKQKQLTKPNLLSVQEVCHGVEFFLSTNSRNITNQIIYYGGLR